MRKIVFHEQALTRIQRQILWYRSQYSEKSVRTMSRNLHRDISSLAAMPGIGRKYRQVDGKQYYIFPSKKKADIIYTYDDEAIYIIEIQFYFFKV